MVQALLWGGLAIASFAAAAVLVFAIVRMTTWGRTRPRFPSRAGRVSWPEFERAFADYVRALDGRRS